jgi:hypothetical protein
VFCAFRAAHRAYLRCNPYHRYSVYKFAAGTGAVCVFERNNEKLGQQAYVKPAPIEIIVW